MFSFTNLNLNVAAVTYSTMISPSPSAENVKHTSNFQKLYFLPLLGMATFLAILLFVLDIGSPLASVSLRLRTTKRPGASLSYPFGQIYVVSLPTRQDRRQDMEKLRTLLGLSWTYFDAFPADNSLVGSILGWVDSLRTNASLESYGYKIPSLGSNLTWPEDIEELVWSDEKLELWNSDPSSWPLPPNFSTPPPYPPIACATKDFDLPDDATALREHLILTPARVACWHSHISVIQQVANVDRSRDIGATLILEDDVDMESDIQAQLSIIWPALPHDWDMVFLGHCWSNEAQKSSLSPRLLINLDTELDHKPPLAAHARLHPSVSPKCTHAYALSRNGARRLLLHLRYPPFAYSRAIDQAIAWLIQRGKLKSFSVVPSLMVQRKITTSDVMAGKGNGSKWRDNLTNGALAGALAGAI